VGFHLGEECLPQLQVVFGTAAARRTEGRRRSYNKLIKAHTKIVQQQYTRDKKANGGSD